MDFGSLSSGCSGQFSDQTRARYLPLVDQPALPAIENPGKPTIEVYALAVIGVICLMMLFGALVLSLLEKGTG